ncbi:MAG: DUF4382 domain-containing protein [Oceanococcus sp.]
MNKITSLAAGSVLCFFVIEGSWGDISGTGSEGRAISFGFLSLLMMDAPVDEVDAVVIEINRLDLLGSNARFSHHFNPPQQVDVLALQGGVTLALLDEVPVPSGQYDELRLGLNAAESACRNLVSPFASYVERVGVKYPLVVARGGPQQELSFPVSMAVADGQQAEYVMDIDLRRGLNQVANADCYRLQAAARIENTANTGHVYGSVEPALLTASHCDADAYKGKGAALYAYRGADAMPSDINGRRAGPLATAALVPNTSNTLDYKLAYLAPGKYTIALTCQAGSDQPNQADTLSFEAVQNVLVRRAQSTLSDFE